MIFWEGAPLDFGRSREVDICHRVGSREYDMEVSFYVFCWFIEYHFVDLA